MVAPALRTVPQAQPQQQPQALLHVVLRSGSEEIVGAQVVAAFATEHEANEEAQRLFAKTPEFHFWHVVIAHEMVRTTVISPRSTGAKA